MVAHRAFAKTAGPSPEPGAGERLVLPMNRNWRYSRSAVAQARMKDFDDSKFERVVVPHTNIRLPWHGFDDKDYEFVSVYRRHFKLPAKTRGRHVFVESHNIPDIVQAVTTYVARRLVERQRALDEDPTLITRIAPQEADRYRSRRRWRALAWLLVGFFGGIAALVILAMAFAGRS